MWYLWSNCFPIVCFPDWEQNAQSLKRQVSKRAKRWNSERKRAPNFNFWCLIILEDIFSSGRKVGVITSRVLIFHPESCSRWKLQICCLFYFHYGNPINPGQHLQRLSKLQALCWFFLEGRVRSWFFLRFSISLQMRVHSNRVLEWFYWLLNRLRTFQYRKNWKILLISPVHLNFFKISLLCLHLLKYPEKESQSEVFCQGCALNTEQVSIGPSITTSG